MFDPSIGQWTTEDPIGISAGDSNFRRYVGNNGLNAVDPSGLAADAAKEIIQGWVDKFCCPEEKKVRMKKIIRELIDAAQFTWNRPTGTMGKCDEWVNEAYPHIKPILTPAAKDGISVFKMAWAVTWWRNTLLAEEFGVAPGHNALRISVRDCDPGNTNGFEFYLDDGYLGGDDHVFVTAELNAAWPVAKRIEKSRFILQDNLPLEDMHLEKPIGPGVKPHKYKYNLPAYPPSKHYYHPG